MTIHLPKELESSIEAVVHSGHFTSMDEAMAEAARLLLRSFKQPSPTSIGRIAKPSDPALGSIGSMNEDADLLDEVVADTYKRRREEKWRDLGL